MSQGSSHAEFLEEPTAASSLVLLARGLGLQGEVLVEEKERGRAPEDANGKTWDFHIFKSVPCSQGKIVPDITPRVKVPATFAFHMTLSGSNT